MSKELTPLEAWKLIDKSGTIETLCIIETALKDYELLKERTKLDSFECLLRLEEILPRGKELLIPVAKQLKALEIIKKKKVDTLLLFRCFEFDNLYGYPHFGMYNQELYTQNITQEEYELLKEVLK